MEYKISQIAEMLGGIVEGNPNEILNNIAKIEDAQKKDLCFLANPKYEKYIYSTSASAVLVALDFIPKQTCQTTLIKVKDPYLAFSQILDFYQEYIKSNKYGVEEPSFIGENSTIGENNYRGAFSYIGKNCTIGNNVKIYPNTYIGDNSSIGNNVTIYAGVKIYENCIVGNNCKIQAGAVIGSEGFGFVKKEDNTFKSLPQLGNVILEDFVEIGANTTIDCATMGSTIIKKGSKIDNLVQIAHNVEIGENTGIAAQAGISGSTKIGNECIIAGQVGLVGHISIANKTTIGAQSGVSKTIQKEGLFLQGSPAFDYKENLKSQVIYRKLPDLQKQIEKLNEKIVNLSLSK